MACTLVTMACKPKPTLMLAKTTVGPGDAIVVEYKTPPGYKENAWVGIIPSEIEHGNETRNDRHDISYKYLKGSTSGTLSFTVPKKPGKYDFRMHDTDNDGMEVASVSFLVIGMKDEEAEAAKDKAQAQEVMTGFKTGDQVMVKWKGSWWPAEIIKVRKSNRPYRIHYDGYSKSWDEWIGDNRIKRR